MLYLYITLTFLLLSSYTFLLLFILFKWEQPKFGKGDSIFEEIINYSIVIPVRNEGVNILNCLNSILNNKNFDIEHYEIIVIDDYSEDNTSELIQSINSPFVKLLSLKEYQESNAPSRKTNAFKKAALNLGFTYAKGKYIIQLDGDVLVPENYLNTVDLFVRKHQPNFVAAPVVFESNDSLFQNFQTLDFLGMMLVTQAGIESKLWYMANGANMIYKRDQLVFNIDDQASGDDVFGIQAIAKINNQAIHFLKSIEATVVTQPALTLKEFINQRMRWATKNKKMDLKMKVMMLIPFLNTLLIPFHFVAIYFFGEIAVVTFFSHLIIKLMVDFIYLNLAAEFFKKSGSMKHFVSSYFLHTLYIGTIGLMSLFVKHYSWKGRKVY